MNGTSHADSPPAESAEYRLTLFVAGDEVNSRTARANLGELCEHELQGRYSAEIIDVLSDFDAAAERGIVVTPTLVIQSGGNERRVIGNLKDRQKLRAAIGLSDD